MAGGSFQVGFSSAILEPGIRYYFEKGRKGSEKSFYDQITNVESSTKAKETLRNYGSLATMTSFNPGQNIPPDTLVDGVATVFTHVNYGKIVGIDKESIDDDQYGIVKKMGTLLGRSVRVTKEIVGHAPFNAAFTTALSDGKVLCASDHPLTKSGGTASNLLGTAADPSYTCWAGLNTLLQVQKDDAGNPLHFSDYSKIWLVHPDFYDVAIQAVNSTSTALVAGTSTANSNSALVNPWYGKTTVLATPWLTDADSSFLIAAGGHEVYTFVREDATTDSWMEKNPRVFYTSAVMRLSSGAADWRGIVGTPGAG